MQRFAVGCASFLSAGSSNAANTRGYIPAIEQERERDGLSIISKRVGALRYICIVILAEILYTYLIINIYIVENDTKKARSLISQRERFFRNLYSFTRLPLK